MIKSIMRPLIALAAMVLAASAMAQAPGPAGNRTPPSVTFGALFERVALSGLFPDGKRWADAEPRTAPTAIMRDFRRLQPSSDLELRRFVDARFTFPPDQPAGAMPPQGLSLRGHVASLWPILTRQSRHVRPGSALLPLPHSYVVPGGRFREIYYWDSYFTMLGLGPEQARLKRGMVDNFAAMILTYGHVPNGNRSYYLSRSQPPFFFKMVELTNPDHPARAFAAYLPALKAEYRFWMTGANGQARGTASGRVVRMADGAYLNRYWDDRDTPRDESYRLDATAAKTSARPAALVYREFRAGAESGWDFSSRWFADRSTLGTVRTTDIVPPDLNSLMFGIEGAIAQGCSAAGDRACSAEFKAKAAARGAAMRRYLWNSATGIYDDYLWREGRPVGNVSAASLYPLFFHIANRAEADRTARVVERGLLKPGGLVTTNVTTGQQWDSPNGWAPLQWVAVNGLRAYGEDRLARTIATRWLGTVATVYANTGKLLEKYDVVTLKPGGGGEYPLQDGFGWTNGTTIGLLHLYPDALSASASRPMPAAAP